jgi:hypothetical protein
VLSTRPTIVGNEGADGMVARRQILCGRARERNCGTAGKAALMATGGEMTAGGGAGWPRAESGRARLGEGEGCVEC